MVGNFIAAKSKQDALKLDPAEVSAIATSAARVASLYEIPVNEKTAAWIGLATVLGSIYGTKITMIKLNKSLKAPTP